MERRRHRQIEVDAGIDERQHLATDRIVELSRSNHGANLDVLEEALDSEAVSSTAASHVTVSVDGMRTFHARIRSLTA